MEGFFFPHKHSDAFCVCGDQYLELIKKFIFKLVMVAHTCNSRYSGRRARGRIVVQG
jgi:hypothetical protein